MNTIEVAFTLSPYEEAVADALVASLGTMGYNGFEYTPDGFRAYIPVENYDERVFAHWDMLDYFSALYDIRWAAKEIEDQDWNRLWEENFTPIVVDGRIQVRAGFHEPLPGVEYEIIIEPKMSFGTGHHATTALMLRMVLDYADRICGKRVLDMGCGTGILAIMAAKVGAKEVTGIDIDEWAYRNAMENLRNNHIQDRVEIRIGDAALLEGEAPFDVILANINRNILLKDMAHYVGRLNVNGLLIMSGFYQQDLSLIRQRAEELGLVLLQEKEENKWTAACFYKKETCC